MKPTGIRTGILLPQILLLLLLAGAGHAQDAGDPAAMEKPGGAQVMHAFTRQEEESSGATAALERKRHLIMFVMGAVLLVFLGITATLGIAMALYGKKVFVLHTIFAGFSVTLAIVHAAVAIVWFFPFSSP